MTVTDTQLVDALHTLVRAAEERNLNLDELLEALFWADDDVPEICDEDLMAELDLTVPLPHTCPAAA